MNQQEYAKFLQSNEWYVKCCVILERDNYMCRDCGCIGIHSGSFFKISDINDVNKFLPHKLTFDGKDLKGFCENIKWTNTYEHKPSHPIFEKLNSTYINSFRHPRHFMQFHRFVSDNPLTDCKLDMNENCKPNCCYADTVLNCSFCAFCFDMDLGKTNYAALKYNTIGENIYSIGEKLEIDIYFERKYYSFYLYKYGSLLDLKVQMSFSSLDETEKKKRITEKLQLFKLKKLNVHHEYYLLGKKPWEYSNDALVTLCSECHQKRHLHKKTPICEVINNDKKISSYAQLCGKCKGTGYLPQYSYYCGGICFKCNGEGVVLYQF